MANENTADKSIAGRVDGRAIAPGPALFVGHGSPMNILSDNSFTRAMVALGSSEPPPRAILCVSAHWQTRGTKIVAAEKPRQIFDFYGFPQELYEVRYTPHGAPELALDLSRRLPHVEASHDWGLDHGAWSVLHFMFPGQDVPVFQMSLNANLNPQEHLALAQELKPLRDQGVLILGSGNLVHNLRQIDWNPAGPAHDWAIEFESYAIDVLTDAGLSAQEKVDRIFKFKDLRQAHPTLEHLLPFMYALGVSQAEKPLEVISRGIQNASVSMASLRF